MDLLIISGFLGSGKTTLLLEIAKTIVNTGRKVAIIENEVGKIGVDDQFLKENGLHVREIFSGCICCSLRLDLITTLLEIEREHSYDVVILEPSGVAGPKQVVQSLYGYGGDIQSKIVLSIIDAPRFGAIKDYSLPLIADGIEIADAAIINKIDLVDAAYLAQLQSRIKQVREDIQMINICARTGENLDKVSNLILSKLCTRDTVESKTVIANAELSDMPHPVVITAEKLLSNQRIMDFEDGITLMVKNIADGAKQKGCPLIGHIKVIAKNKGGYMFAGITDFDSPVSTKGRLAGNPDTIKLTVNAIVYGIDRPVMETIVEESIADFGVSVII